MLQPIANAIDIISSALQAKSITRTNYNYVRRCVALFNEKQTNQWLRLADAIWDHHIPIVEDGDKIFPIFYEMTYERQ